MLTMIRKLIINCDDFGQSPAMNQAIMHLLEEGKVSSATIMAVALDSRRRLDGVAVGSNEMWAFI